MGLHVGRFSYQVTDKKALGSIVLSGLAALPEQDFVLLLSALFSKFCELLRLSFAASRQKLAILFIAATQTVKVFGERRQIKAKMVKNADAYMDVGVRAMQEQLPSLLE